MNHCARILNTKILARGQMPIEKIVITKFVVFSALIGTQAEASAKIDPVTQIYTVNEIETFANFNFKRSYSSRSIFRGHFGTGWCSELDGRILTYDGGEMRYRGCDVESALLVDARESVATIRRIATGFSRLREDGATQFFNQDGYLTKVIRSDGELRILRKTDHTPAELSVRTATRSGKYKIEIAPSAGDVGAAIIRAIGSKSRYEYSGQMLTTWSGERRIRARYAYDDHLNMTSYESDLPTAGRREIVKYDDLTDRAIRFERSSAFERERLLLTMNVNEKSGTIEMNVEVERGEETHPVSILYNLKTRHILLEGSRDAARLLLSWMRT